MTGERIDVEITDSVNPAVAKKIRDIAEAARAAENSVMSLRKQLSSMDLSVFERASAAQTKLASASARQASAAARLTNAQVKQQTATTRNALAEQKLATETQRTAVQQSNAAAAAARATAAMKQQEIQASRLAAAKQREKAATDATIASQRLANRIRQTGSRSRRQELQQTQNLIFQLNDVVVGLASGQKPATVLLQQGSQISTIYGPGNGVLGTFRLIGASLATIFAPMLPAIGLAATLGAGIFALSREIDKTTSVSVSFGDTLKAVFQVAGRAISDVFGPAVSALSPLFTAVYEAIKTGTKATINFIVGLWVGGFNAVKASWDLLPAALRDVGVLAMNFLIDAVQTGVNAVLNAIGDLLQFVGQAASAVGRDNPFEGLFDGKVVDLAKFKGEVTGAAEATVDIYKQEFNKALGTDFAGQAFDAIRDQAIKNGQARAAAEAAKAGKGGREELSDYEKLLNDLNRPIIDLQREMPLLNRAFAEGRITLDQYMERTAELRLGVLELGRDLDSGLKAGLIRTQLEMTNVAEVASNLIVDSFKSAEDAIVEFVQTGKTDFKGLVDSMIADLIRLQVRQASASIFNTIGGDSNGSFLGSVLGSLPSFDVGTTRVPNDMVANVHKDEIIIPAAESRAVRAGKAIVSSGGASSGGGGAMTVVNDIDINVTGSANDNQSTDKIARAVRREVEASMAAFTRQQQKVGGLLNQSVIQ